MSNWNVFSVQIPLRYLISLTQQIKAYSAILYMSTQKQAPLSSVGFALRQVQSKCYFIHESLYRTLDFLKRNQHDIFHTSI